MTKSSIKKLTKQNRDEKISAHRSGLNKCSDNYDKLIELKLIVKTLNTAHNQDKLKDKFIESFRQDFHSYILRNDSNSKELLKIIMEDATPHSCMFLFKGSEEVWDAYLNVNPSFTLGRDILERGGKAYLETVPKQLLKSSFDKSEIGGSRTKYITGLIADDLEPGDNDNDIFSYPRGQESNNNAGKTPADYAAQTSIFFIGKRGQRGEVAPPKEAQAQKRSEIKKPDLAINNIPPSLKDEERGDQTHSKFFNEPFPFKKFEEQPNEFGDYPDDIQLTQRK